MATSHHRGHPISYDWDRGEWIYIDTGESLGKGRDCAHCGRGVVHMEVSIPARLSHSGKAYMKKVGIDKCIAPIIQALNDAGITTEASCCGHGRQPGSIILAKGIELRLMTFEQARKVDKLFSPIND